MDYTESLDKEGIIRYFRKEISKKLSSSLTAPPEDSDLNAPFLELVKIIKSSNLTGDEAAEVFDELAKEIDNQPPRLWIDKVAVPIDEGSKDRAKHALSFRAERFFRDHYREQIKSKDLPGKMEFISERLEALGRIPLGFGQIFVMPALEYLNDELERKFERLKKTKERRAVLGMNDEPGEPDRPKQFTRKQAIYLLQELIPEFKTADNTRKAEFITRLTGYASTKNIADEFSNLRSFADPKLLEQWKEKFKTSGRGRKKISPSQGNS